MFTKEEISYMQSLGLNFDFSNLSDEEWVKLEDTVGDQWTLREFDEETGSTPNGRMCQIILSKLP